VVKAPVSTITGCPLTSTRTTGAPSTTLPETVMGEERMAPSTGDDRLTRGGSASKKMVKVSSCVFPAASVARTRTRLEGALTGTAVPVKLVPFTSASTASTRTVTGESSKTPPETSIWEAMV
jgi:hypothetical protein